MKEVNIEKSKLIKIVKENREKHETAYDQAVELYFEAAAKEVDRIKELIKESGSTDLRLNLIPPVEYKHEYNKVIKMLELSEDEIITLSSNEFESYVMDEWHWKQSFNMANFAYTNS